MSRQAQIDLIIAGFLWAGIVFVVLAWNAHTWWGIAAYAACVPPDPRWRRRR